MRRIKKRIEPRHLTEFQKANERDPNFGYDLIDSALRSEICKSLVAEQRGLCAYTGLRIDVTSCHIEHLKAQDRCTKKEAVSYKNMVGCYPQPNFGSDLPYGAHKKGSWPSEGQDNLFISPLSPGCEQRFSFNFRGEITAANAGDDAAKETIKHLGLDHAVLDEYRQSAIKGTLKRPTQEFALIDVQTAQRRMQLLDAAEKGSSNSNLDPFCFVLRQTLRKHIARIRQVGKKRRG
jgi:uncharacterized protein (TIGR02646 family)